MSRLLTVICLLLLVLYLSPKTLAVDFTTNYKVDYFLDENNGNPLTKVKMQIDIINHTAGSYISKFGISFPKSFKVDNPTALYKEPITPQIQTSNDYTTLQVQLPQPTLEDANKSTVYFDFYQENLFKINGNVWEVILPTVQLEKDSEYQISLHLPENSSKKLSISKPKPTTIQGDIITWENPDVKTIYATFGSKQYYSLHLKYHLNNPDLRRVYTDVAFPPDELYQKTYIEQLDPKPALFYIDEDGNYLGRYYLNPKESKDITYKGAAEIYSLPRPEVKTYQSQQLDFQKKYLLQKNKYWNVDVKSNLNSIGDIFSYVTSALQYDTSDVNNERNRLGANEALRQPNKAVCTEFTDVFVALARQKGYYAREIEGYGYSADTDIRPISTNSDILHAWPEYYSSQLSQWVAVDPTWQNTSGINYFDSLDLNHIIFAIHGKDPDYPLPAGTYKTNNSKDVSIQPTAQIPNETDRFSVDSFNLPAKLFGNKVYNPKLTVENNGNIFLWNVPVQITSDFGLNKEIHVDVIAPGEKKEISVPFKTPNALKLQSSHVTMNVGNQTVYTKNYQLMPYYYDVALKLSIIATVLGAVVFLIRFRGKKRII